MTRYDALVIGGGPAGCATALYAAKAGLSVALVDRARFPRPKPCGEGLMPAGIEVLEELGLREPAAALGRPFYGVRYLSNGGRRAQGRFPDGRYGLGLAREEFDALLWRAASAEPGVHAFEGRDPSGFTAAFTAVCDGGRSLAARSLGAQRRSPRRRRFGLAARFEVVRGLDDVVEVFLTRGAELYLTPLSGGRAAVAALVEEHSLGAGGEAAYERFIRACPALSERLAGARRATPVRGLGPLGQGWSPVRGENWLLAGDAAGALDPIIGEGMAAALLTGRLAGRALAEASRGQAGALPRYARRRRRLLFARRCLAAGVLALAARPVLAEACVAGLGKSPRLFSRILSLF